MLREARLAMEAKTEVMQVAPRPSALLSSLSPVLVPLLLCSHLPLLLQTMMMAFAEAEFFASAPVLLHQAEALMASAHPVDLLVNSFTLTGIAAMISECAPRLSSSPPLPSAPRLPSALPSSSMRAAPCRHCKIPMAGFILQPSAIPSSNSEWKAVEAIDSWTLPVIGHLIDSVEEKFFTSHQVTTRPGARATPPPAGRCARGYGSCYARFALTAGVPRPADARATEEAGGGEPLHAALAAAHAKGARPRARRHVGDAARAGRADDRADAAGHLPAAGRLVAPDRAH
jgi:hypothetical protein